MCKCATRLRRMADTLTAEANNMDNSENPTDLTIALANSFKNTSSMYRSIATVLREFESSE